MELFTYFRSSTAYRVRIALNLKGIAVTHTPISLLKGEQRDDDYAQINPQRLVPTLKLDDGTILTQSMAICEYLDEVRPEPPLMPADPVGRARVRALAQVVGCDIHPVDNLRVLKYLTGTLNVSDEDRMTWYRHWIKEGFAAFEAHLDSPHTGRFCHGDSPTLADICLVPQVFNARRFTVDMTPYPRLAAITEACEGLNAFKDAHPGQQSDAL
ncbi:MAG: maleylacetoacetate isomerase [Myxococcota bacterium]